MKGASKVRRRVKGRKTRQLRVRVQGATRVVTDMSHHATRISPAPLRRVSVSSCHRSPLAHIHYLHPHQQATDSKPRALQTHTLAHSLYHLQSRSVLGLGHPKDDHQDADEADRTEVHEVQPMQAGFSEHDGLQSACRAHPTQTQARVLLHCLLGGIPAQEREDQSH